MSRVTRFTTTRLRKRFRSPCAIKPSTSPLASPARCRPGWLALRRRLLLTARVEDRLHPLLLSALDHAPILGEEDRDALTGDHVVLLPDPCIADEHDALFPVVVLPALRRSDLGVLDDDLHVAARHRADDAVALGVEIDLHPVRV